MEATKHLNKPDTGTKMESIQKFLNFAQLFAEEDLLAICKFGYWTKFFGYNLCMRGKVFHKESQRTGNGTLENEMSSKCNIRYSLPV